jgi:hypothetical protein
MNEQSGLKRIEAATGFQKSVSTLRAGLRIVK